MFGKASGQEQKQLHMACAFVCAFVFALLCVYMIRGGETCEAVLRRDPGGVGVKVPGPQTILSRNFSYWGPRALHVKPLGL